MNARSHMALLIQNVHNVLFIPGYVAHYEITVIKAHLENIFCTKLIQPIFRHTDILRSTSNYWRSNEALVVSTR